VTVSKLPKSMGGGVSTAFLQTKTSMTAMGSAYGSNEDDTKTCLGFLVYRFAGLFPLESWAGSVGIDPGVETMYCISVSAHKQLTR
jgi:hypothetical protein